MNQYGAVYSNGVMSPPPSKQASMQSQSSNGSSNGMYGFAQTRTSGVVSPNQNQVALFHDGYTVSSPQPIPQSPYPVPTPTTRSTLIEDPEYQEYLEHKRRQKLLAEQQQIQQQPFGQQQEVQQWAQQQQRSPQTSPSPFPLPAHLHRPGSSAYGSIDDADPRYQPQYQQQYQSQYQQQFAAPQPYIHAVRPGHTYGKITARGKAKIMIGNGVSGKSNGFERQHNYGEVDIQDDVQVRAGDFDAAEISTFFRPPPPPTSYPPS